MTGVLPLTITPQEGAELLECQILIRINTYCYAWYSVEMAVKQGYRTVQLCFKTYSTTVSLNQRVPTVTTADGHVGATSISAPEQCPTQAHVPGPLAASTKPFFDIPGSYIT